MHDADRRAVLRRLRVEIIGGIEAAGSRHALHDKAWIAGDMLAHVIGKRAGIFHIAPGHAGADDDADLLVFIEGGGVLRLH